MVGPVSTATPVPEPAAVSTPAPVPTPAHVATATPVPPPPPTSVPDADPKEAMGVVVGGRTFAIEVAVTPEERQRGLSGRESMPVDAGMLFVFEEERVLSFWMRETLIPLDIVFIDGEKRIVDIQTMVPELDVPTGDLTVYLSSEPAMYALEVNAGVAAELGLMVGMVVTFR